jgi:hypothetical protein
VSLGRIHVHRTLLAAACISISLVSPSLSRGQSVTVRGVVRDSTTNLPIAGAVVTITAKNDATATRSDEAGEFSLGKVPSGLFGLQVRRIGYRPIDREIRFDHDTTVVVLVSPNAQQLAPVRVGARGAGIYGIIATAAGMQPIAGARVFVGGIHDPAVTDSTGEFFIPLKAPGSFVLRVAAKGFGADMFTLEVKKDQVAEASRLLDIANESPRTEGLWKELDQRLRWKSINGAMATGVELRKAAPLMSDAIQMSSSVQARLLRIGPETCVFINGAAQPTLSLDNISLDDVVAVEVYGPKEEASRDLASRWPADGRRVPGAARPQPRNCGENIGRRKAPGGGPMFDAQTVMFAVIWTKR